MEQPAYNSRIRATFPWKRAALLAVICIITACAPLDARGLAELKGWEYLWGDASAHGPATAQVPDGPWLTALSPLDPPGRGENTVLWLRALLPDSTAAQPSVYLNCVYYEIEAFYRGKPVYGSGAAAHSPGGTFRGRAWHIIPLPADAGGDHIYLRVQSLYREIGIPGPVCFGRYSDLVADIIHDGLFRATVALLLVLCGILALFLYAQRRHDSEILWAGCALVLLGLWNISNTRIKLLYLDEPLLWLYLEHTSLYFSPVALGLFLEQIFGKGPGYAVRRGWQLLLVFAVLSIAASAIDPYWLRAYTLRPFQVLLTIYLVVVCTYITREALRGDIEARIVAGGLAAAMLTGLYDIAVSFMGLSFILPKISYAGILACVVSLGILLDRRLRVVPEKLMSFTARQNSAGTGSSPLHEMNKKQGPASITPEIKEKLDRAIAYLQEHYTEDLSREGLAGFIDLNHDYFGKMFLFYTGKKVSSFINELRVTRAADLLISTDQSIINVAYSVGFESLSTFYRIFQRISGLSPLAYRDRFKKINKSD